MVTEENDVSEEESEWVGTLKSGQHNIYDKCYQANMNSKAQIVFQTQKN